MWAGLELISQVLTYVSALTAYRHPLGLWIPELVLWPIKISYQYVCCVLTSTPQIFCFDRLSELVC
jgi:hypothetical protein